jgi:tetratricopeptide (TPR) repeat protein
MLWTRSVGSSSETDKKPPEPVANPYTAKDVAAMLNVPLRRLRTLVDQGLLSPQRGKRREYRFSFQDLVFLRSAKGLTDARVPAQRIRRTLRSLTDQLDSERPISALTLTAGSKAVVPRHEGAQWHSDTGQTMFDFAKPKARQVPRLRVLQPERGRSEASGTVAPLRPLVRKSTSQLDADGWYEVGCETELSLRARAIEAYRKALGLAPDHPHANINLGRLLHEAGELEEAEEHYRRALGTHRKDETAAFNLGTVLEDQGKVQAAIDAYQRAIAADPRFPDAHFNLARLYEQCGRPVDALRHLKAYRTLVAAPR